jgi:site-specific recombinase XerD
MGKVTKHLEGHTKEARSKVRKNLGSLKQLTVQPKTRARYENARKKFYTFLNKENLELPRKRDQLDSILAEYIDWL